MLVTSRRNIRIQRTVWWGNRTHVLTCMLANIDLFHEIKTGTAIKTKKILGTKLSPFMKHSFPRTPSSPILVELMYSPQNADGFLRNIDDIGTSTTGRPTSSCWSESKDSVDKCAILLEFYSISGDKWTQGMRNKFLKMNNLNNEQMNNDICIPLIIAFHRD